MPFKQSSSRMVFLAVLTASLFDAVPARATFSFHTEPIGLVDTRVSPTSQIQFQETSAKRVDESTGIRSAATKVHFSPDLAAVSLMARQELDPSALTSSPRGDSTAVHQSLALEMISVDVASQSTSGNAAQVELVERGERRAVHDSDDDKKNASDGKDLARAVNPSSTQFMTADPWMRDVCAATTVLFLLLTMLSLLRDSTLRRSHIRLRGIRSRLDF